MIDITPVPMMVGNMREFASGDKDFKTDSERPSPWLVAKRINMNESLLSQYVNGKKEPSVKQVEKILSGIKSLGKELSSIEFV